MGIVTDGYEEHPDRKYERIDRRRPADASDPARPLAENVGQFPQPTSIGLPVNVPAGTSSVQVDKVEVRLPVDTGTYDYPEGSIAEELYRRFCQT